MKSVKLLKYGDLEKLVENEKQLALDDNHLLFTSRSRVFTDMLLKNVSFKDLMVLFNSDDYTIENYLLPEINKIEVETGVSSKYFLNDIVGASIYLRSPWGENLTGKQGEDVGFFDISFVQDECPSVLDTYIEDEARSALINIYSLKHGLKNDLEGNVSYNQGFLKIDGSEQNYRNMVNFMNDYSEEVNSSKFLGMVEVYGVALRRLNNLRAEFKKRDKPFEEFNDLREELKTSFLKQLLN